MALSIHTSPAHGTGLLGIELERCYGGPIASTGKRDGLGRYAFPNSFFAYEGEYSEGVKHGPY